MAEAERFFSTPSAGDSGAPTAPPPAATTATPKKRKKSVANPGTGGKTKRKHSHAGTSAAGTSGGGGGSAKDPTGLTGAKKIARPLSGFNLAGRPGLLQTKEEGSGIKSLTKKFCRPISQATINTDTEWTFVVTSHKGEFIRFFANSMTASLYSTFPNPNMVAGGNAEQTAARHSTRSFSNSPKIFFDPSVMGTSLIKSVRVTINGVPVQSNNFVDPHLLHYVRCARIFNSRPEPFLATQNSMGMAANRTDHTLAMKTALKPFDHVTWEDTRANRVPIYLDGIWPFDHQNRTIESIDKQPEPPLYLPPDSRLEITVELHRNRFAGVFHNNCNDYNNYFVQAGNLADSTVITTIQDVLLEYESCELSSKEHDEVIRQYREGKVGNYDYDIVRSQHQILDAGVAYSIKWFQIQPHCRLAYILFLKNHSIFPMPNTRRPISGWSRFPVNCTNMKISFAGCDSLITEDLKNFGINSTQNEISKKIYFDYLTTHNMFAGTMDDLFGNETDSQSIIQIIPLELKHLESTKTERLSVELKFANADLSPVGIQLLVLSVHNNGRAVCSADKSVHDWKWEFQVLG